MTYGTRAQRRARAARYLCEVGPIDWAAMQRRIVRMSRQGRRDYLDRCHALKRGAVNLLTEMQNRGLR